MGACAGARAGAPALRFDIQYLGIPHTKNPILVGCRGYRVRVWVGGHRALVYHTKYLSIQVGVRASWRRV